jgi:hypothetical protein
LLRNDHGLPFACLLDAGAGVPLETRKALPGHAYGDITTHYSAAEPEELLHAAEKIVDRGTAQSPTLTLIRRTADKAVRKMLKGY